MSVLKSRRIVITGAGGYLGRRVVDGLRARQAIPLPWHRDTVDLSDFPATLRRLKSDAPWGLVHLAASLGGREGGDDGKTVEIARHVRDACRAAGVELALQVGTLDEYGDGPSPFREDQAPRPLTPYAAAKAAAAGFWAVDGGTHVRLALVYGPGQDRRFFVPQLLHALASGEPLAMSPGDQVRDLVFVDDAVEGVLRLLERGPGLGVVNLCSGVGHPLKEVVSVAQNIAGRMGRIEVGARPYRPHEVFEAIGDPRRLEILTGWKPPTSLADGLSRTWEAFALHG